MSGTVVRVAVVAVEVHEGTFPDPGALAASIERCLTDRRHGLAVPAVRVTEIGDVAGSGFAHVTDS
jgi:hypothetical protein